jgi:hypothetical protein
VPTSDIIELDFCSRPLLDERGKKVWELLVTDADRSFVYSQYFPNSKINSVEVRVVFRRQRRRRCALAAAAALGKRTKNWPAEGAPAPVRSAHASSDLTAACKRELRRNEREILGATAA